MPKVQMARDRHEVIAAGLLILRISIADVHPSRREELVALCDHLARAPTIPIPKLLSSNKRVSILAYDVLQREMNWSHSQVSKGLVKPAQAGLIKMDLDKWQDEDTLYLRTTPGMFTGSENLLHDIETAIAKARQLRARGRKALKRKERALSIQNVQYSCELELVVEGLLEKDFDEQWARHLAARHEEAALMLLEDLVPKFAEVARKAPEPQ